MKYETYNPWKGRPIPRDRVERAIKENGSMTRAARSLGVAYNTFKKYAKLYDLWRAHTPKESAKFDRPTGRQYKWSGHKPIETPDELELQKTLIREGKLIQKCSFCGYDNMRKKDLSSPLMLHFNDFDRNNKDIDNLRLFCYNCFYVFYHYFKVTSRQRTTLHDITKEKESVEQLSTEIDDAFQPDEDLDISYDEIAKEMGVNISSAFDKKDAKKP